MELRTKTLLFILASFLLGGIAGGFIGKTYFGSQNGRRPSREEFHREFARRLKLDSVQAATVDTIFEAHREKFSDARKHYSEMIKQHRDTLRAEIRKILTLEQNKLYDGFIKELEEREAKKKEDSK